MLSAFYTDREKGHVDRLAEELFYEERNIYRLKDRALERFAEAYFGAEVILRAYSLGLTVIV